MGTKIKRRVLVVDDDSNSVAILTHGLQRTGRFDIRGVTDSREALDTAVAFKPDIVVLDVIMPHKDGGEVAAEIRNINGMGTTPIIFRTAIVSKGEAAQQRDGDHYLAKPVSLAELTALIDQLCR